MTPCCVLLQIVFYVCNINSLNFTLSAGPASLPTPLYGAICALNSQNQWICIGGCNTNKPYASAHYCYQSQASKNIYMWDVSQTPLYTTVDSIDSVHSISLLWNPSNGYPYPIDLRNDIMYIPWNDIIFQYDTRNKQWMNQTNLQIPVPAYYTCSVYDKHDHKIYLLGGTNYDSNGEQLYIGSVQIYDLDTHEWTYFQDIQHMPFSVYGGSCVLSSRTNSIYYFGGRIQDGDSIKSILKYKIDTNEWSTLSTELPSTYGLFGHRSFILHETNILIIGGAVFSGTLRSSSSGIYSFDIITESLYHITNMEYKRYASQVAFINDRIYIAGGMHIKHPTEFLALSDTQWSIETFNTDNPTDEPTIHPTQPTDIPTISPLTKAPTDIPTILPSVTSTQPTDIPTISPLTNIPTISPLTKAPTDIPTILPSVTSTTPTDIPIMLTILRSTSMQSDKTTVTNELETMLSSSEIIEQQMKSESHSHEHILTIGVVIIVMLSLLFVLIIIGFICLCTKTIKIEICGNKAVKPQHILSYSVELQNVDEPDEGTQNVFTGNDNDDQVCMELNETNFDD